MDKELENSIRHIVRDEIARSRGGAPYPRSSAVEMPLRRGEVERQYPVVEAARLLGMSREWVYQRINDGTFTVANFGDGKSKRRIPASSINSFIKSRTYS